MDNITIDSSHKYHIAGSNIIPISVTTLIKKWFNVFDEDEVIYRMINSGCEDSKEQILKKWKKMRENGTILHSVIEAYLTHQQFKLTDEIDIEFNYFLNFLNKHSNLKFYASEKMIYSSDKKVAGTVDCLMTDEEDRYYLIDWKCSNSIKPWSPQKGFGPFSKLNDCNYIHYMLQLNIYRHILETNYNIKIYKMWLVNLHRNNNNYYRYSIERYNIEDIWNDLIG